MKDPKLQPVTRGPGRPPLDPSSAAPSAGVHVKLQSTLYDQVDQIARARRQSIPAVIRHSIEAFIKDERGVFRNLK